MIMIRLRQKTLRFHLGLKERLDLFCYLTTIEDYLRALGVKDLTALPRCAILPTLDSAPQAFGCLYALEISTLGWQFVARHLNRSLGVGPGAGCSFFESYGDQAVRMWGEFGQQIKKYAVTGEIEEAMSEAAVDTFGKLEQWMIYKGAPERQRSVLKLVAG